MPLATLSELTIELISAMQLALSAIEEGSFRESTSPGTHLTLPFSSKRAHKMKALLLVSRHQSEMPCRVFRTFRSRIYNRPSLHAVATLSSNSLYFSSSSGVHDHRTSFLSFSKRKALYMPRYGTKFRKKDVRPTIFLTSRTDVGEAMLTRTSLVFLGTRIDDFIISNPKKTSGVSCDQIEHFLIFIKRFASFRLNRTRLKTPKWK